MLLSTNNDVLLGFRAGDTGVLARIYRYYLGHVRGAIRAAIARRRPGTAFNLDDLVQEVFARAFTASARQGYDGVRPYGPYLSAISRNIVAAQAQQVGREVVADPERMVSLASDPASDLTQSEARTCAQLARLVGGLPPDLRAVYAIRFEAGQSQRDACTALGVTRQSLRTLERKLVDGMRRRLGDDPPDYLMAPAIPVSRRSAAVDHRTRR
jgi:RNA polymerase sigma factor (sigma-70 family)